MSTLFQEYLYGAYILLAIGLFAALIGAWLEDVTDVNPKP